MRVFYIDAPATVVIEGTRAFFPPQSLTLTRSGSMFEIWTTVDQRRVAGPMPYQSIQDQNRNTFADADATESYLLAEFGKHPEKVEDIGDLVEVFEAQLAQP